MIPKFYVSKDVVTCLFSSEPDFYFILFSPEMKPNFYSMSKICPFIALSLKSERYATQ